MTARRLALGAALAAFLVVSVLVARWLTADGDERAQVERLLAAQARGDEAAMARRIAGCDEPCRRELRRLAVRLGSPGEVEIVRYDSATARSLGEATGPTRVVWRLVRGDEATLPTVQCVGVRRTGGVIAGRRVTLTDLSGPIAREGSC